MDDISIFIIISAISIIGLSFVSTLSLLIRRSRAFAMKFCLDNSHQPYTRIHNFLFSKKCHYEALLFTTTATTQLLRISCILSLFLILFAQDTHSGPLLRELNIFVIAKYTALLFVLVLLSLIAIEFIPRLWIEKNPKGAMRISSVWSAPFLILVLPFTYPLFQLLKLCTPQSILIPLSDAQFASKERLFDYIQEGVEAHLLTQHDKKLLFSVLQFKDRIAREVMVPRVHLFCLSSDTSIKDAAIFLERDGYSRVPVYDGSIDKIVGVLMFKDILLRYMEFTETANIQLLLEPIESLVKDVLYTPETKNIAQLLQEFIKKRMHMAIVVDEYGGTAGLVTIEDILEEIVGEIGDEYDEEPPLFIRSGKNAWIVDARMNLLDLEEELGIKIPQDGEYDTIAGYIFFRLETIPEKGVCIHHDAFDLEIIASNERSVEKVKITQSPLYT